MTALIGGSILLIVASAAVLIFGWIGANENLIWGSIAASVAAAVCLALAYAKSRTPVGKRNPPPKKG